MTPWCCSYLPQLWSACSRWHSSSKQETTTQGCTFTHRWCLAQTSLKFLRSCLDLKCYCKPPCNLECTFNNVKCKQTHTWMHLLRNCVQKIIVIFKLLQSKFFFYLFDLKIKSAVSKMYVCIPSIICRIVVFFIIIS
jgi:hypothetical protein